ncbi:hypothetical protein [Faunimonas pinastri]|uniref:hypothetical protein n=1 Tax=Faunimonas pinastri TaxID=1855383 RepID=UPI000B86F19F|nr:hypothetical protein [Faunimonas pinastri]
MTIPTLPPWIGWPLLTVGGIVSIYGAFGWMLIACWKWLFPLSPLGWAEGKTRFRIWEAACYIEGIALGDYEKSDKAKGLCTDLAYYTGRGLLRLANETDSQRNMRAIGMSESVLVDKDSILDRESVLQLKDKSLRTWLPAIDKASKEAGF